MLELGVGMAAVTAESEDFDLCILSIHQYIYLSIHPSAQPSVHRSICPSTIIKRGLMRSWDGDRRTRMNDSYGMLWMFIVEGWAESSPGVQVIVESGVGNGGSTRAACAWAHAVPGRPPVGLAWNGLGTY